MKLELPKLSPASWDHLRLNLGHHAEERNPGTGYVGFQPAATPRAAKARRAGKAAAQTNAKVKFGDK